MQCLLECDLVSLALECPREPVKKAASSLWCPTLTLEVPSQNFCRWDSASAIRSPGHSGTIASCPDVYGISSFPDMIFYYLVVTLLEQLLLFLYQGSDLRDINILVP